MTGMEQNLVVGLLVLAASIYTAWKIRKVIAGQGTCACGPGGCQAVGQVKKPNLLEIGSAGTLDDDTITIVSAGGCGGCSCRK
jgi:hypothetical protein